MTESEFKLIVKDNKDRVYNTCLGLLQNQQEAEDLAQEVFIHVFQKADSFRGDAQWSTWIYRIAVNKCLEHIRRQKAQKRNVHLVSLEEPQVSSNDFVHPGVQMENKENARILFRMIQSLSEDQKTAFTLKKVEGLSSKEIAEIMKKTTSAVDTLIHRAKENLKKTIKSTYEKEWKY